MNANKIHFLLNVVSLLILISISAIPVQAATLIPVSGDGDNTIVFSVTNTNLTQFIEQEKNGSAQQITGLYVEDLFSFPVIQQPSGQPAFVSSEDNLITQFQSATAFGSLGFVAHNTLAGAKFSGLTNGSLIFLVYGDGHYVQYQVTQVRKFQAVEPNNPYSSFIDLANNQVFGVEEVFYQTYGVKDQLVLQTCISSNGIDSWGRLFVIASPYTPTAAFRFSIPYSQTTSV
jgi:hypothetical protein